MKPANKLLIFFTIIILHCRPFTSGCQDIAPRLAAYDIHFYQFDLEITNRSADLNGVVSIEAVIIDPDIDSLALELINEADIDSIYYQGSITGFSHRNDSIMIPQSATLNPGESIEIKIFYELINGDIIKNRGVTNYSADPERSVTFTLSEPFYSKYWFPCKQVLSDKIDSAYLNFTIPKNTKVGSNGVLINIVDIDENRQQYKWRTHHPMAFYLLSFAVANYLDYSFTTDIGPDKTIYVQNYVYNDSAYLEKNKADIDETAALVQLFSDKFGTYPYADEKYGHCIAPASGGMEHQTMTTLSNFNFELIAHELGHQWFGNYVTCSNWQDIWINEGFASYTEFIAYENLRPAIEKYEWLQTAYSFITAEEGGTVYVPDSEKDNDSRIFDYRLSYRKGAYLIHMIRHSLKNDDLFFEVLRTFLDTYRDSVASATDFKLTLEELTHIDYTGFFDQWYYGSGRPILDFKWKQQKDTLFVEVIQETTLPEITPFFNLSIDLAISYLGGDTTINIEPKDPNELFTIPLKEKVFLISPDPENWLLADKRSIVRVMEGDSSARFAVFPNPSENLLYIENYDIGLPFTAKLYNSAGLLLTEKEGSEAFTQINLGSYAAGTYQIIVARDEHREIFKVAKL